MGHMLRTGLTLDIGPVFSMDGTGPIYVLPQKTTMKAALYQDILKDYLLPHYKIGNIFQQDNARYHTTKEV